MVSNDLKTNMMIFVSSIGYVTEAQIRKFFRNRNDYDIQWVFDSLKSRKMITVDKDGIIQPHKSLNLKAGIANSMCKSAWIIANLGEDKIRDFYMLNYPFQLLWIDEDNNVSDSVYINENTLQSTGMLFKRIVKNAGDTQDTVCHTALVETEELAQKVLEISGISKALLLGKDGNISVIEN